MTVGYSLGSSDSRSDIIRDEVNRHCDAVRSKRPDVEIMYVAYTGDLLHEWDRWRQS